MAIVNTFLTITFIYGMLNGVSAKSYCHTQVNGSIFSLILAYLTTGFALTSFIFLIVTNCMLRNMYIDTSNIHRIWDSHKIRRRTASVYGFAIGFYTLAVNSYIASVTGAETEMGLSGWNMLLTVQFINTITVSRAISCVCEPVLVMSADWETIYEPTILAVILGAAHRDAYNMTVVGSYVVAAGLMALNTHALQVGIDPTHAEVATMNVIKQTRKNIKKAEADISGIALADSINGRYSSNDNNMSEIAKPYATDQAIGNYMNMNTHIYLKHACTRWKVFQYIILCLVAVELTFIGWILPRSGKLLCNAYVETAFSATILLICFLCLLKILLHTTTINMTTIPPTTKFHTRSPGSWLSPIFASLMSAVFITVSTSIVKFLQFAIRAKEEIHTIVDPTDHNINNMHEMLNFSKMTVDTFVSTLYGKEWYKEDSRIQVWESIYSIAQLFLGIYDDAEKTLVGIYSDRRMDDRTKRRIYYDSRDWLKEQNFSKSDAMQPLRIYEKPYIAYNFEQEKQQYIEAELCLIRELYTLCINKDQELFNKYNEHVIMARRDLTGVSEEDKVLDANQRKFARDYCMQKNNEPRISNKIFRLAVMWDSWEGKDNSVIHSIISQVARELLFLRSPVWAQSVAVQQKIRPIIRYILELGRRRLEFPNTIELEHITKEICNFVICCIKALLSAIYTGPTARTPAHLCIQTIRHLNMNEINRAEENTKYSIAFLAGIRLWLEETANSIIEVRSVKDLVKSVGDSTYNHSDSRRDIKNTFNETSIWKNINNYIFRHD